MGFIGLGRRIQPRVQRTHFVLDPEADEGRPACRDELIEDPRRPAEGQQIRNEELAQDLHMELIRQAQKSGQKGTVSMISNVELLVTHSGRGIDKGTSCYCTAMQRRLQTYLPTQDARSSPDARLLALRNGAFSLF